MTDQIAIGINDKATADVLQQELASNGIHVNRLHSIQAVQFGMKISTARGSVDIPPREIIQLVSIAPDAINTLFNVLESDVVY